MSYIGRVFAPQSTPPFLPLTIIKSQGVNKEVGRCWGVDPLVYNVENVYLCGDGSGAGAFALLLEKGNRCESYTVPLL